MQAVPGIRSLRSAAAGARLAALAAGVAAQQPCPSRPIRLIVPLAPGGTGIKL